MIFKTCFDVPKLHNKSCKGIETQQSLSKTSSVDTDKLPEQSLDAPSSTGTSYNKVRRQ